MAFVPVSRVLETGSGSGTGDVTLSGAQGSGEYDAFNERLSVSDSTFYVIVDGSSFEIGYGSYSAATPSNGTFTRDTVIRSSSGTGKISLSGSAFNIFGDVPPEKLLVVGPSGAVTNVSAVAASVIPKDIASLKALDEPSDNTVVGLGFGVTEGDGLGGLFRWDDTSTTTADDVHVIELDSVGSSPGRWIRERQSLFLGESASDPANDDQILRRSDTHDIKSKRSDTGVKTIPEVENFHQGEYTTLAGLKAVASTQWAQGDRIILRGVSAEDDITPKVGTWQASSTNTDALDETFVRPDDISGVSPGRFQFQQDINALGLPLADGGTAAALSNVVTFAPNRRYVLTASDTIDGIVGLADGESAYFTKPASGSVTLTDGGSPGSGQALSISGGNKIIDQDDKALYCATRVGSVILIVGGANSGALAVANGQVARSTLDRVTDQFNVLDYFQDDEAAVVERIKARTSVEADAPATDAAISAAYAAMSAGDALIIPSGLYNTEGDHVFEKDYMILDFEPGAIIQHWGDNNCITFRPANYATSSDVISGIEVRNPFLTRGDNATVLSIGLRIIAGSKTQIVRPRIHQFPIRINLEGGVYQDIQSPRFRTNSPNHLAGPSQSYLAGSRLIGLVAHYWDNAGTPTIKNNTQVTISDMGTGGVNVDYGILIESADGLQMAGGSFAVMKKAQIAGYLDAVSSSIHQVSLTNVYFDGGVTPHATPHNIHIDATNRPTASGGVWDIKGGFIGNDLEGDGIPVLCERPNTRMNFTSGRSTTNDRAVMKMIGDTDEGELKVIGWTFDNCDNTSTDDGVIVADGLHMLQVVACSFENCPTSPIKLLNTNAEPEHVICAANIIKNCGQDIDKGTTTIGHYVWNSNTSDDSSPEADTGGGGFPPYTSVTPTVEFLINGDQSFTVSQHTMRYSISGKRCAVRFRIAGSVTHTTAASNFAMKFTGAEPDVTEYSLPVAQFDASGISALDLDASATQWKCVASSSGSNETKISFQAETPAGGVTTLDASNMATGSSYDFRGSFEFGIK